MTGRTAFLACAVLVVARSVAFAQAHDVYVGGTLALHVQPRLQPEAEAGPLGGSTWGGSVVVGRQMSARIGLELETYVSGRFTGEYSYNPGPSWTAHVVTQRRDTFFSVQVRGRVASLEPVVGVSYVLEHPSRHATALGQTYFDDADTRHGVAAVGGLDAPMKVAPRIHIVPTFRVFVATSRNANDVIDPLGSDTRTGRFALRLGVGARVAF